MCASPSSGLGHGGGSVGLEARVGPLVREQSQGHGVHSRLEPWLLADVHRVVVGLEGQGVGRAQAPLPSQAPGLLTSCSEASMERHTSKAGWPATSSAKGHHWLSWLNLDTSWSP